MSICLRIKIIAMNRLHAQKKPIEFQNRFCNKIITATDKCLTFLLYAKTPQPESYRSFKIAAKYFQPLYLKTK